MSALYPQVKSIAKVNQYFPDYKPGVRPDRDYFFKVVGTLMKDWLLEQIKAAFQSRNEVVDETKVKNTLEYTEAQLHQLEESHAISSK